MTESTHAKIPQHLRRYIVDQDYSRYTPEDQAVWRFIMRQLKNFLSQHAHPIYLEGLNKTGLEVDKIPLIDDVDAHLERFGWGAVPVSGFIPPAAFMEFQSIGVLPVASDMRTLDHLLYTPAPDIVHEAAGHAPILVDPDYARYLRQYGDVARHSIISKEDMAQYEAIRLLSDIKEDPQSTPNDIARAEKHLGEINHSMKHVSEAALLSRMNWWTAEYGLIGSLEKPRIFGAGLLSSVGESQSALQSGVRKIRLSVDCVNYTYDITEKQPQLFVTEDFAALGEVLEQLACGLAYRRGGSFGLDRAIEAETVNTVQWNSGLQASGLVSKYLTSVNGDPAYVNFEGPCQLAIQGGELANQGTTRHAHGFSSPVGMLRGNSRCLSTLSNADLAHLGVYRGRTSQIEFSSGVKVEGVPENFLRHDGKLILMTWKDCRVTLGSQTLFDPAWGEYDMAVGSALKSVFGGPADRSRYGRTEDFVAKQVPKRQFTTQQLMRHQAFQCLRDLRDEKLSAKEFKSLHSEFISNSDRDWLQGVELLELSYAMDINGSIRQGLLNALDEKHFSVQSDRECIRQGIELAQVKL